MTAPLPEGSAGRWCWLAKGSASVAIYRRSSEAADAAGDMPVLELVLRQLRFRGIKRVVLAVNHLHHLVQELSRPTSSDGLKIIYSVEDEPMGTAAPLSSHPGSAAGRLPDPQRRPSDRLRFRSAAPQSHADCGADLTVATHRRNSRWSSASRSRRERAGHRRRSRSPRSTTGSPWASTPPTATPSKRSCPRASTSTCPTSSRR